MSAESYPSQRWLYVNHVTDALTQYTGILGSGSQVNENPLAVDTLLAWCNSQYITGVALYSIDGSPFHNSGSTTFTAVGLAKLRDFVSRCKAVGIDVAIVWNGENTNFAEALINYNQVVNVNEKIVGTFIENEFWRSDTKQTLLDLIANLITVKDDLNTEGIEIYGYLGHTHSAGYQYPDDSTPITENEIEQLEGYLDYFCFHDYTRIPNYSYVRSRVRQLTTPQNVLFIISTETPDNNATGGFDPTDSYFDGWFIEGRDTSITPVIPNDPPPVIYPRKSLIDCYNYIVHLITSGLPNQSGSAPEYYDLDSDPGALNANVVGIVDFAWSYTHPLNFAPGLPPNPPPSGLVPWQSQLPQADILLLDILYTINSMPQAPVNPQPTDYDLSTQTCVLLYDILISLIAGGGGGSGGTNTPTDITLSQAIDNNNNNSWILGQLYRIVDPPSPLVSYTARALENISVGEVRLSTNGLADIRNYDSTVYEYQVLCGWDFSDFNTLGAFYIYDSMTNVKVWDANIFSSNALDYIQWNSGTIYNSDIINCVIDDLNEPLTIQDCNFKNTHFNFNNSESIFISGTNAVGATINFYANSLSVGECNLKNGSVLRVYGDRSYINLDQFSQLKDTQELNTGAISLNIGQLSVLDLNGFNVNYSTIGVNISFIAKADNSYCYCDGDNSTFSYTGLLSDTLFYNDIAQSIAPPPYHGIILIKNDTGSDATILGISYPPTVFFPLITLIYEPGGADNIILNTGGNILFPDLITDPQTMLGTPDQISVKAARFSAEFLIVPDNLYINN